jgi:hypothetical protein
MNVLVYYVHQQLKQDSYNTTHTDRLGVLKMSVFYVHAWSYAWKENMTLYANQFFTLLIDNLLIEIQKE